ncbi:hypothetical protein BW723_11410 [Polaribacter reichenbachii]|uniref:Gylcosyl hydrolase 115 C-terminal domain-containing protein n=1 Tax=Polaribacter reichenbachii TaxID=996801 RepID=A0A1B8TPQ4_9FLAO|nr:glycosyl hydrolase 115 family protein [Polaribacter reichenbachii]APZ46852.1 hypothetical protein BW723_11410 [Polaribacter reichenbachii]AUC17495.1 hypothetical protein BTO17_01855 [Polaribacter reichenbachii]OBY61630.1 hypothetical protein LPB301_16365 [Polaribacter reichenbachii]
MSNSLKLLISLSFLVFISCTKEQGFPVFNSGKVATIYVSQEESPQIIRAVNDLQKDIKIVTGSMPTIIHSVDQVSENTIIIGTIHNPFIQQLDQKGLLNEAKGIDNLKQSFLLKSLENPSENIKNALVVAGSDALGTVYGIYEISEKIGVSPLYWWADVVPQKKNKVILKDCLVLPKEPSVEYRGIFINDEEALTTWSEKTSKNETNTHPSPEVYKRVFELLLRLKANTIWPGMMLRSSYFFEAKDKNGIPINPKNAKEYGIYVGASHCEQMGRNNYDEWYPWAEAHKDMFDAKGVPVWDYTVNPKTIEAYWQERLDESKDFNMIYTLGIRGVHDSPFRYENLKNPTLENKVKLLQTVIDRQRAMIKTTFGSEDAVPQVFIPYEETGELYNGESKDGKEKAEGLKIPDDVIMVWTEDNFGHARQLPNKEEQKHPGGNGIYYHLAYQGYPTTYDWLYTTPLPLVQEELRKVYDNNARKFWIVNVGDIKPAELGLQFFMSLAYDIDAYPKNTTKTFIEKTAQQHFNVNAEKGKEIADLITDFHTLTWSKKPEPMVPFWVWEFEKNWMYQYYSLYDFGDEAQRHIEKAKVLEQKAKAIYDDLDESAKIPFWHLAYYPIKSTHYMLQKAVYYRKNIAYTKQGRLASVNAYKVLSEKAEAKIQKDLKYYKEIINGKWDGIMDPYAEYNSVERVFDVANIPNNLVYNQLFKEEGKTGIGAVCEGQVLGDEDIELRFSSFEDNQRFIDIFNKEVNANSWTIETNADWINFTKSSGSVKIEERILVSVDWSKTKNGINTTTIIVRDTNGFSKSFPVKATQHNIQLKEKSYIEGNGFLTIEAEHYQKKTDGKLGDKWEEFKHYGYKKSSMFLKGGSKIKQDIKEEAAKLEYSVYFTNSGTFYGELYRLPTLNEGKGKTCEIGIGLDDESPKVLTGIRKKGEKLSLKMSDGTKESLSWHKNVLALMEKIPFEITVDKPGYHTLTLYQVDTNIGVDRLVICTDEQTKTAQKRSLIGAPESFNTINYTKIEPVASPEITDEISKVDPYKKLEPLTDIKLNFGIYSMLDAKGFTAVNQRHTYNPNKNLFGWRASDVKQIGFHHNEASARIDFWQRDGLIGKKEAKFYVKLKKGTYDIKYYMGDSRIKEEWIYSKGKNFEVTFKINGKTILKKHKTFSGVQKIDTVTLEVLEDELVEFTFADHWIINALIINRK